MAKYWFSPPEILKKFPSGYSASNWLKATSLRLPDWHNKYTGFKKSILLEVTSNSSKGICIVSVRW